MNLSKEKIREIVAKSAKKHGSSDENIFLITSVIDDVLEEVEREQQKTEKLLCRNCLVQLEEQEEVTTGEKFRVWYCPSCGTYYELVARDYLERIEGFARKKDSKEESK